jgi:hypothetical protein
MGSEAAWRLVPTFSMPLDLAYGLETLHVGASSLHLQFSTEAPRLLGCLAAGLAVPGCQTIPRCTWFQPIWKAVSLLVHEL